MILIQELYKRYTPKAKNKYGVIYSLVQCDDCKKERAIPCYHAIKGNQSHFCHSCKCKGKRNHEYGRKGILSPIYREKNPFYGKRHSPEIQEKNNNSLKKYYKTHKGNNFGKTGALSSFYGRKHSEATKAKMSIAQKTCNKKILRGSESPNFNHNITNEERQLKRDNLHNTHWRLLVFHRDSFTCQICDDNEGGNLEAHHLNNWSDYKEQRYDINNGVTLCDKCHKTFHAFYGYNHNNYSQFLEFYLSIFY